MEASNVVPRFRSFIVNGRRYFTSPETSREFRVPDGKLIFGNNGYDTIGRWLFVPTKCRRVVNESEEAAIREKHPDELPRFTTYNEAVDLLCRGGAFNQDGFCDIPQDVKNDVMARLGEPL